MEFRGVIIKIKYKKVLVLTEDFNFEYIYFKEVYSIGDKITFTENDIVR